MPSAVAVGGMIYRNNIDLKKKWKYPLTHTKIILIFFFRSPLGFSELFNEFRLQENLHSLDDILNAIINSEGMSFNDLKPIYKEFLLKLAVTLTKDELYQRSKSIMRRQKKKLLRRNNKAYQVNIICLTHKINSKIPFRLKKRKT